MIHLALVIQMDDLELALSIMPVLVAQGGMTVSIALHHNDVGVSALIEGSLGYLV